jgi:hypothetical protein
MDGRFVCASRGIQIVLQNAEPQQRWLSESFGCVVDGQRFVSKSCQLCSLTKANNRKLKLIVLLLFFPSLISQKDNSHSFDTFSSYSNNFGYPHRPNTDWIDLVLQPYPFSSHYTQGMSYIIRQLEPDQQYEAKVIAR